MPSTPPAETREQWLERTENARRSARFKFALKRVDKIAAGEPPLTAAMRAELARRILASGDDAA